MDNLGTVAGKGVDMRLARGRGKIWRAHELLAVTIVAAASMLNPSARAQDSVFVRSSTSLRILPWTAPIQQKDLIELLKERDSKDRMAGWVRPVDGARGPGLLDPGARLMADSPATYRRPIFGTIKMPFGTMSLVSKKIDANGNIAGLDFMRLDNPNWDIGIKGTGLKITHRWGTTGGERPFADPDKKKIKLPN